MLSRDVPTAELIAEVRPLLAEFFAADLVTVILRRGDEAQIAAVPGTDLIADSIVADSR
jgi:hypothetical protein